MFLQKIKKGFTLVELIVVISILAILSTIGFIAYSSYLAGARDTNRITQVDSLQNLLEIYRSKSVLPYPDDKILVVSGITNIGYQGYIGANILSLLEFSKGGKDPKENIYFSYYLSNNRKKFQIMTFLEKQENLTVFNNAIIPQSYAIVTYSKKFVYVIGNELGILTDVNNIPIQEIPSLVASGQIDLAGANSGTIYLSHLSNFNIISEYGNKLQYSLLTKSSTIYEAPKLCGTGYIPVPGNAQFNQKGFCVAKYEMSFDSGSGIPNSIGNTSTWNTYAYTGNTYITPKNDYPIADITQGEAIIACNDIGTSYHLITNNEWNTIARNVELQKNNWSSGIVGNGYIYAGNTGDTGNTIGCTDSTGPRANGTKTGGNDKNLLSSNRTTCSEKKQLLLSNGEIIWDFAGNVAEYVNKANTLDGTLYNSGQTSITGCSPTISYTEWTTCSGGSPANLSTFSSTNGIGKINYSAGVNSNVFIRSGRFGDTVNAGIYNLDLGKNDTYKDGGLGFRCAK